MKKLIVMMTILALSACGAKELEFTGLNGANGADGASITGAPGADGKDGVGQPGADGFNSLIAFTKLSSETEVCQSGSGFLFSAGLDINRNGALELEEIAESSIAVVCDGAAGLDGLQGEVGPAGRDGQDGIGLPGAPGADGRDGQDSTVPGPVGPAGAGGATLTSYTVGCGCTSLGDGFYASDGSSYVNLYTSSTCKSSGWVTKLSNTDEVYLTGSLMFFWEEPKVFKVKF